MKGSVHRVLLIGMMGAGKSTTGREVAARLGWPFLDSDAEVERRTGRTIPEIWRAEGEAAFRAEESRVLAEALTSVGPTVVAVAGGAVLNPDNRRRIKSAGLVVWLRTEVATLVARLGAGAGRPLIEANPTPTLAWLYAERRPLYEHLADLIVDVDHLATGEVADRVIAAARGARRGA